MSKRTFWLIVWSIAAFAAILFVSTKLLFKEAPVVEHQAVAAPRVEQAEYRSLVQSPLGRPNLNWEGFNRQPQDIVQRLGWMLHYSTEPLAQKVLERINSGELQLTETDCSAADMSFTEAALLKGSSVYQPALMLCPNFFGNVRDLDQLLFRLTIVFHEAVHVEEYFASGARSQDLPVQAQPLPATEADCEELFGKEMRAYYNQCVLAARWGLVLTYIDCSSQDALERSFVQGTEIRTKSNQQSCVPTYKRLIGQR